MKLSTRTRGLAVVLLLVALIGCAKKTGTNQSVTPWEQVMVSNAMFANANNGVKTVVINVNAAGLLSNDRTAVVLTHQAKIAAVHIRLMRILNQGPNAAKGQVAEINSLLDQIKIEADQMVTSGNIEIKDPATQVTIKASIDGVVQLAQMMLTNLKAAGVLN